MKITNQFYFSIIPEWITESNISDGALRVYSALCRFADKDNGSCFPSHLTIGKKCNKSVSAVKRALKELEKIGAIEVKPRYDEKDGQTSNLYIVKYITDELGGQFNNEQDASSQTNYKLKPTNDSHTLKQAEKQGKNKIRMTLNEHLGYKPNTQSEKNNFSKTVKELYEANATVDEIVERIYIYKKKWKNVTLTHIALRNNWSTLGEMAHKDKPVKIYDCSVDGHKYRDLDYTHADYKLYGCIHCSIQKKENILRSLEEE